MIGTTLNHYRVTSAWGSGGMGEVHLADDTKLKRAVAIKILPPGFADSPDRLARFEREAQAIAALNHPNIVTVYSVEQSGDTHFMTMEYVEGHVLADLIPPHGLPLSRLLAIATQLVDAVIAAHGRGIVHRDLKPANVMVTSVDRVERADLRRRSNGGFLHRGPRDPRLSPELSATGAGRFSPLLPATVSSDIWLVRFDARAR